MATVVMNMNSSAVEHEETYGEEIMNAGWNPAVLLAMRERLPLRPDTHAAMPADLAAMDLEQFVRRMYVYLSYE